MCGRLTAPVPSRTAATTRPDGSVAVNTTVDVVPVSGTALVGDRPSVRPLDQEQPFLSLTLICLPLVTVTRCGAFLARLRLVTLSLVVTPWIGWKAWIGMRCQPAFSLTSRHVRGGVYADATTGTAATTTADTARAARQCRERMVRASPPYASSPAPSR